MTKRKISRRSLLRGAAGGGAALAMGLAGIPLVGRALDEGPGSSVSEGGPPGVPVRDVKQSPGPGVNAPGFVIGTIVAIERTSVVVATDEGDVIVDVTTAELIWKGRADAFEDLTVGDHVYVNGTVRSDGVVEAKFLEANLVQLRGRLDLLNQSGFTMSDDRSGVRQVRLDGQSVLEVSRNGVRVSGAAARLSADDVGAQATVIGLQLADGTVRATKIWISRP